MAKRKSNREKSPPREVGGTPVCGCAGMIVQVLWDGLSSRGAVDQEHRVTHAAVHAWYEGHIEGETARRGPPKMTLQEPEGEMPAPPFPARDSRTLAEIVKSCTERYKHVPHAGVVRAVADAWEEGYREGLACPGCHFRGSGDPRLAHSMRNGGLEVSVRPSAMLLALGAKFNPHADNELEDAARQALVNLFASSLRRWEEHGRKDMVPSGAASLDMLMVALDVFGQLNCYAMDDAEAGDEEVAEVLMEGVTGAAKVAIADRVAEIRQIARSANSEEEPE